MAKLTELCSNIPETLLREHKQREIVRREIRSYVKRMTLLRHNGRIFDQCVQRRPNRGKVKNRFSVEQAGTIGNIIVGIRTGNHSVVVCKSKKRV